LIENQEIKLTHAVLASMSSEASLIENQEIKLPRDERTASTCLDFLISFQLRGNAPPAKCPFANLNI
jgi:hypothetical protein